MTRMIERWFPCSEVSACSAAGWGSGNQEKNLFTWFAARPTAQAKAAVICSLLPWPESSHEQARLQDLVRRSMAGRYAAWEELREAILSANPGGASILDPFSGRGMIPLEASRLALPAFGIEYSPVAVIASELLTDYPFRDWDSEPDLPFTLESDSLLETEPRLLRDVRAFLTEVGKRFSETMAAVYPAIGGRQPWGYLWAVTLPCQECGRRFPLVGSYELRGSKTRKASKGRSATEDPGQSFYVEADVETGNFKAVVHDGPPMGSPILTNARKADGSKIRGKSATCPFCSHVHPLDVHQRLAGEGFGVDTLLVVADIDSTVGKAYREPTDQELTAAYSAHQLILEESPFARGIPAVPNEAIPPEIWATVRAQLYGAKTYGDLMVDRQTLAFIRLSRVIATMGKELADVGVSDDYSKALTGYAAAAMVKKLKRSTRGATLQIGTQKVDHIYANESTLAFSYDYFESGLGSGPGTWESMVGGAAGVLSTVKGLLEQAKGLPATIISGSAVSLPIRDHSITAVVTDPPYDAMVYYSDSSDLLYVWLKRALHSTWPEITVTSDARGLQAKSEEIIVWGHHSGPDEHRDRRHYDTKIAAAFSEMRRVVADDGLVTIVFGHGEPDVWQRLLTCIHSADLVMTGSWPANTEAGGQQGKANIKTTLTMSCRPAPIGRPIGRKGTVESAIKAEVKSRYPDWERWALAPTDMLMAAAGPAMEIVGRYSEILDAKGEPVDISTFLPLARSAVQEAMAVEIDHHPLETFDARTRFALWWVRLFGREIAPKSELRWQTLAASLELADVRDLVPDSDKGCHFVQASKFKGTITIESTVIDVVLALAAVSDQGRDALAQVLAESGRDPQDAYLWAAVKFLADRLPDSDPDSIAFNRVMRARDGIGTAVAAIEIAATTEAQDREENRKQERLF